LKKIIFIMVFMILMLMQPCLAVKIVSNVTIETDITGLDGKLPASAIIMQNGSFYDAYTDAGLLGHTADFNDIYSEAVNEIGKGEIFLRVGEYYLSETLNIPCGISLNCEHGTTLIPCHDFDMIRMHPGSSLHGGIFEPRQLAGFSSSVIYISSDDPYSDYFPAAYRYRIEDVDMWGVNGTAILLDATSTPGYNGENGLGGYICGVTAHDVNVLGFDHGLWLRCDINHSFINGNQFNSFSFTGTKYSVYFDAVDGAKGIDGNVMNDFHVQYMQGMLLAFGISGRYNRLSAMIWDWAPDTAVIFQKDSGQNYALLGVDKSKIVDNGVSELMTRNTIVGYI